MVQPIGLGSKSEQGFIYFTIVNFGSSSPGPQVEVLSIPVGLPFKLEIPGIGTRDGTVYMQSTFLVIELWLLLVTVYCRNVA